MDTELKPCPFCGEEAGICEANDICFHRDDDGNKIFGGWRCFCPSCAIEQIGYETREEAVSAWNNRSTEHATHRAPVDEKGGGRMTGIERLRELVAGINPITVVFGVTMTAYDRKHKEVAGVRLRDFLADIADQIDRELREERSRWDDELCDAQMDKTCVMAVYLEMNRHVLGHEGMEDSPVARWARELREALGGDVRDPAADVSVSACDPPSQEDRDAIAWVREHGGLERVKAQRRESIPRAAYDRKKAGFLDHIAECERALGRRREIISELNRRVCDLTRENAERGGTIRELSGKAAKQSDEIRVMRDFIAETCARLGVKGTGSTVDDAQVIWREIARRLMPEGYEWPRYESGEPLRYEDRYVYDGREREVWHVDFDSYGEPTILNKDGTRFHPDKGERVKRPAPKVLDADGAEIRVGDTVYHVKDGSEMTVYGIEGEWLVVSVGSRARHDTVTHRAPVLAADGKPLEVGQTVYAKNYDYVKCTVLAIEWVVDGYLVEVENEGGHKFRQTPDEFTHQRPVLDADGVEIRVGDAVWSTHLDEPHEWIVIDPHEDRDDSQTVLVSIGDRTGRARPENLTHRALVLAADGRPLREGETVWDTNGDELVIGALEDGGHTVTCRYADVGDAIPVHGMWSPSDLTHERPDSWERIEEDAEKDPCGYFGFDGEETCGKCPASEKNCEQTMAQDLVRRAKKLVGDA